MHFPTQILFGNCQIHFILLANVEIPSDTLSTLDFDVVEQLDANLSATERAMDRFLDQAKDAKIAMIHFSGHGIELFDINPDRIGKVKDSGIDLTHLSKHIKASHELCFILIIDACRNDPFAPEQALKLVTNATRILQKEAKSAAKGGIARGVVQLDVI